MSKSRREFIAEAALLGAGLAAFPSLLLRAAQSAATAGKTGRQFVLVFLRGAADGLNICVPYGDPDYYRLRPSLAIPPPGRGSANKPAALKLNDLFALHPALAPLLPLYQAGELAFVHAVGSPQPTRSHFDAQDYLGLGTPGRRATETGFLTRALTPRHPAAPLTAVAFGPQTPACLRGFHAAIAGSRLDALVDRSRGADAAQTALAKMYGAGAAGKNAGPADSAGAMHAENSARGEFAYGDGADDLLRASAEAGGAAVAELRRVLEKSPPGAGYGRGPVSEGFRQLAQVIKADAGLQAGSVDIGGWDHHSNESARLDRGLGDLAAALRAFRDDLGARLDKTCVVVVTEFGRMAKENGAGGSDHGHGSLALVLGGGVRGGRVHGRWPGLRDQDLYDGRDLAATTDFRDLLSDCLGSQFGPLPAELFPGYKTSGRTGLFSI